MPQGWSGDDRLIPDSVGDTARLAGPGQGGRPGPGSGRPVPPRMPRPPAAEPELAQNFLTTGTPATDSWPRQQHPSMPAAYQQGTWPQQPSRVPPGRGRPARHTGRVVTIALLAALFAAGIVGTVAYRLANRSDASTPPPAATKTITVPPGTGPATIVREYFTAINARRYRLAWELTPETQPFGKFVAGFAGTEHDYLKIVSVQGDVVTAELEARQTSGVVKIYEGTYTVTNGVISGADVEQIS
jgi:hypothetical protein